MSALHPGSEGNFMDSDEQVQDVYAVCRADFVANQRCRSFALLPQNVDPEVGDEIAGARLLCVEERHGVAGTGPALEPQEIRHRFLRMLSGGMT